MTQHWKPYNENEFLQDKKWLSTIDSDSEDFEYWIVKNRIEDYKALQNHKQLKKPKKKKKKNLKKKNNVTFVALSKASKEWKPVKSLEIKKKSSTEQQIVKNIENTKNYFIDETFDVEHAYSV